MHTGKLLRPLALALACALLCACGQGAAGGTPEPAAQSGSLTVCLDGAVFTDPDAVVRAFQQQYPDIQLTIETLPDNALAFDTNYTPYPDPDSLADRQAALQQQRTMLMSGSCEADLFLVGGGVAQYSELNGGALVQDPYDLMRNDVLADLSGLLAGLDQSDYLGGTFEGGALDGRLLFVPLWGYTSGIAVNLDAWPQPPTTRRAMAEALTTTYAGQMGNVSTALLPAVSLSYPVVNRLTPEISLYDGSYTDAVDLYEQCLALAAAHPLQADTCRERLAQGDALIAPGPPLAVLSMISQDVQRGDPPASYRVGFFPFPNEKDGVTMDANIYAFAPAKTKHLAEAETFLHWLLSEEVQSRAIPVFPTLSGYPVRKGCAGGNLASMLSDLDCIGGQAVLQSLADFEDRVTDIKYSSHYDAEFTTALLQCQAGQADLDAALADLYQGWAQYLDE